MGFLSLFVTEHFHKATWKVVTQVYLPTFFTFKCVQVVILRWNISGYYWRQNILTWVTLLLVLCLICVVMDQKPGPSPASAERMYSMTSGKLYWNGLNLREKWWPTGRSVHSSLCSGIMMLLSYSCGQSGQCNMSVPRVVSIVIHYFPLLLLPCDLNFSKNTCLSASYPCHPFASLKSIMLLLFQPLATAVCWWVKVVSSY